MLFMEEVYEQTCRFIPGASWTSGFEEKKPYNWANYVNILNNLNIEYFKINKNNREVKNH